MKIKLQLIRARLKMHMVSDNHKVSRGSVDGSLYNRRIAFIDDCDKEQLFMLPCTPVELN